MFQKSYKKMNDANDLLGIILNVQNSNGDFLFTDIFEIVGESRTLDVAKYVEELSKEGYIKQCGINDGHCYPHSRKAYMSTAQKIWCKVSPALLCFSGYIIGLVNDDIKELFHASVSIVMKKVFGA